MRLSHRVLLLQLTLTTDVAGLVAQPAYPIDFTIGKQFNSWNGVIDDVRIYNVAVSNADLLALYSAGASGICDCRTR